MRVLCSLPRGLAGGAAFYNFITSRRSQARANGVLPTPGSAASSRGHWGTIDGRSLLNHDGVEVV